MYRCIAIETCNSHRVWPHVSKYFEIIVKDNPTYTSLEFISDKIKDGSYTLICVLNTEADELEMAMVFEIVECPTGRKILMIPHLAGVNMSKWIDELVDIMHELAHDLGCEEIMISGGRLGWVREMKNHGGELSHVTVKFDVLKRMGEQHG